MQFDLDILLRTQVLLSGLQGQARLPSDFALSHGPQTACPWKGLCNKQDKVTQKIRSVMVKLAILGQNEADLVDCSEFMPIPPPLASHSASVLPGFK